jgi:hypothetical protein
MSTVNARNRGSCIPSFASKVGTISAGSRSADCLHGWRETNPTNVWLERDYCASLMRGEQGMQVGKVKECENQAFWWICAQTCRRACGRRGLVGERRESAPDQMSHKAKMQKTANQKAAPKIMQRRDAQ